MRGIQEEGVAEGCGAAAAWCDDAHSGDDVQRLKLRYDCECATVSVDAATAGGYFLDCGRRPATASENRCGSLRTPGSSCRRHQSQITI